MKPELPAHDTYLAFAEQLANQSRSMLLKARESAPSIQIKADASFVTTTDKAIEAALRIMIEKTFPDHGILGEEFENVNIDAEFVWVLDPIDGTAPFIAGIPVYGTLIGLAHRERPFVGVIDHPATAERWAGVSGRFATHNGVPVQTRTCSSIDGALITCSSPDFMGPNERKRFAVIAKRAQYVQYGGSCYAYGVLASGRTDMAIDGGLDPFDIYASAAVIEGAGGYCTDWNGKPLSFDMQGTVLAAGDKARLDEVVSILRSN